MSSIICFLISYIASKGRSHLLLRNRKQNNIKKKNFSLYKEEESKSDVEEEKNVSDLKDEIYSLTKKLNDKEKEAKQNEKYADLLSDLFQKGIIDAEGNFIQEINEY